MPGVIGVAVCFELRWVPIFFAALYSVMFAETLLSSCSKSSPIAALFSTTSGVTTVADVKPSTDGRIPSTKNRSLRHCSSCTKHFAKQSPSASHHDCTERNQSTHLATSEMASLSDTPFLHVKLPAVDLFPRLSLRERSAPNSEQRFPSTVAEHSSTLPSSK